MAKAAVTRSIRDDHQKNFLKIFNGLTGKHSRWEIWEDFVTLTAIEISNSTDKVNATERTKMYQTIISKYSAKERDGMAEMLAEVEYYNGFKGKEAAAKTLREASQMVVDFIRRVSWHDAKTPPPVHDESWENAGEKHCCIMSELVWVCCESRNTMKGWIENGKWYIEDGRPAADTPYGAVKFWAPLLEPPEVAK